MGPIVEAAELDSKKVVELGNKVVVVAEVHNMVVAVEQHSTVEVAGLHNKVEVVVLGSMTAVEVVNNMKLPKDTKCKIVL